MIAGLVLVAMVQGADTLHVPRVDTIPGAEDSVTIGRPAVIVRTGQGVASVWLLRRRDTI